MRWIKLAFMQSVYESVYVNITNQIVSQGNLPGERANARNNARCTQARKTTHGLDGQHQDVDRTPRGRVNQNDRGQR